MIFRDTSKANKHKIQNLKRKKLKLFGAKEKPSCGWLGYVALRFCLGPLPVAFTSQSVLVTFAMKQRIGDAGLRSGRPNDNDRKRGNERYLEKIMIKHSCTSAYFLNRKE